MSWLSKIIRKNKKTFKPLKKIFKAVAPIVVPLIPGGSTIMSFANKWNTTTAPFRGAFKKAKSAVSTWGQNRIQKPFGSFFKPKPRPLPPPPAPRPPLPPPPNPPVFKPPVSYPPPRVVTRAGVTGSKNMMIMAGVGMFLLLMVMMTKGRR